MLRNISKIAFTVLLFSIVSCRHSSISPGETVISDFPDNVGNNWVYSFYDSLSNKSDILTITIVGQTIDKSASIWQFKYSDRIDTQYVTISQDTVFFSPVVSSPWSSYNTKIPFPLMIGNKWRGNYLNDSSYVAEKNPVSVPAGSFANAYKIVEGWGGFNDYGSIISWFVPKVGIVRRYHTGASFGLANDTFTLVSYNIR